MTSREDHIETAARALWEMAWPYAPWDSATEGDRGPHLDDAAAVLDAVLPQITTVEQLEALPIGTVVVDVKDRAWLRLSSEWWDHCGMAKPIHWLMLHPGVVTVVWQP